MLPEFDTDPYPGKPRILFVGFAESSHTHSWINLLDTAEFNVRLFALPTSAPPSDWNVRTYLTTASLSPIPDSDVRANLDPAQLFQRSLADVIAHWQPHIVHTLGLEPAGFLYGEVRRAFHLNAAPRWVLQLRGGSDLALNRFNPAIVPKIAEVLCAADQILSDNRQNFQIAESIGAPLRPDQHTPFATVPGTGGVDVEALHRRASSPPSQRRVILYPKAYHLPWSTALPVLEALKNCWEQIQPCEVYLLAVTPEIMLWYRALPEALRAHCHVHEHIPRNELLNLMPRVRVLLAPSLVDGVPNTMFEAMAAGALPIVSPLETIASVVNADENVLFARNLYPDEIAAALVRAMTDDALVDQAAQANLKLVRQIADRASIAPRMIAYYTALAAEVQPQTSRSLTEAAPDFPFSSWSNIMPGGQQISGLVQEYLKTNNSLTSLQTRHAALQQEYRSTRDRFVALQTEAAALNDQLRLIQAHPLYQQMANLLNLPTQADQTKDVL